MFAKTAGPLSRAYLKGGGLLGVGGGFAFVEVFVGFDVGDARSFGDGDFIEADAVSANFAGWEDGAFIDDYIMGETVTPMGDTINPRSLARLAGGEHRVEILND